MKLESFKPIKNKSEKFNFDEEILKNYPPETITSYRGLLSHGNAWKLTRQIQVQNNSENNKVF